MKVQAIIAAGGTGQRMGGPLPKPLLLLEGVPLVLRTLRVFDAHPPIDSIILVVHAEHLADYRRVVMEGGLRKEVAIVPGGATRTGSVRMALRQLDKDTDIVIVHDAVRPFVTARMLDEGIELALKEKAAVAGVPVKPTLKVVNPATGLVMETLDRSLVWEIQTPQVFDRQLLERAYQGDVDATDDAGLVEQAGHVVKVYRGDYSNIKITTPGDMDIAAVFLKGKS
ncbi:MAG: 2-C-methyl-D-erythritol 4-phosphate cytidylyltransferase [Candidatus Omnitrophota bacterium]